MVCAKGSAGNACSASHSRAMVLMFAKCIRYHALFGVASAFRIDLNRVKSSSVSAALRLNTPCPPLASGRWKRTRMTLRESRPSTNPRANIVSNSDTSSSSSSSASSLTSFLSPFLPFLSLSFLSSPLALESLVVSSFFEPFFASPSDVRSTFGAGSVLATSTRSLSRNSRMASSPRTNLTTWKPSSRSDESTAPTLDGRVSPSSPRHTCAAHSSSTSGSKTSRYSLMDAKVFGTSRRVRPAAAPGSSSPPMR